MISFKYKIMYRNEAKVKREVKSYVWNNSINVFVSGIEDLVNLYVNY